LEIGSLSNLKNLSIDQSAGVLMPFWSDNNILFLGMFKVFQLNNEC
jgi:coronin-1B/1C/6